MIIFLKKGRKMVRRPLFKSKWHFEMVFAMNTGKGLCISQFSHSVVSDSLQPHGLQDARRHCPSPTIGACSNSCPLSQWCHPTISSCVVPFSSCLQCFPASGSFLMSQFFSSGDQSIGASESILPMNIQDWFPLGLIYIYIYRSLYTYQYKCSYTKNC